MRVARVPAGSNPEGERPVERRAVPRPRDVREGLPSSSDDERDNSEGGIFFFF